MKIGTNISATDRLGDIGALARKVESLGFESLWFPEHVVMPVKTTSTYGRSTDGVIPDRMYRMADPFIALALAVSTTTTLKLGTAVCLVPEHNPIELAKQIATLDLYSGGRFLFGIGTGWCKEESEVMGGDFEHRWTQTRESVLAMKELWTKDVAEFHGRYVDFPGVYSYPKPAQKPHPPVILGGTAKNVHKRVVSWGDGWMPIAVSPEEIRTGRASIDELARSVGRDPSSIEISVFGQLPDRDLIKGYEEAGADRVLVRLNADDGDSVLAELEEVAHKVLG